MSAVDPREELCKYLRRAGWMGAEFGDGLGLWGGELWAAGGPVWGGGENGEIQHIFLPRGGF